MKANQLLLAAILATAIGSPIVAFGEDKRFVEDKRVVQQMTPAAVRLPIEGELPSLGSATEWLNSPPLTAAGLRGKVVLIDFWTYSCINWIRSASLCPRMGREIQESKFGRDRRAHS